MTNITRKKILAGGGIFKTEINHISFDTTKPFTLDDEKIFKNFIKNQSSKNIFERHLKRFESLSQYINGTDGKDIMQDRKVLVTDAQNLSEGARILESMINKDSDIYDVINQAMICMSLYHQCMARLIFEAPVLKDKKRAVRSAQTNSTNSKKNIEKIMEEYKRLKNRGVTTGIGKIIALETGLSEATVSRALSKQKKSFTTK